MSTNSQFRHVPFQKAHAQYISQQPTAPHTTLFSFLETEQSIELPTTPALEEDPVDEAAVFSVEKTGRKKWIRAGVLLATVLVAVVFYFTWHAATNNNAPQPGITQQNYSGGSTGLQGPGSGTGTNAGGGNIQVYVTGAVKHPGVYTLPIGARMYQLLQAAGGALPNANMVALNLAAKLTDGQEVYVLAIGETPPGDIGGGSNNANPTTSGGQLVNINTASLDELKQGLHVSTTTAQKIIDYRTQHGPFTSTSQLLQVVSQSIYSHIKNLVTVS